MQKSGGTVNELNLECCQMLVYTFEQVFSSFAAQDQWSQITQTGTFAAWSLAENEKKKENRENSAHIHERPSHLPHSQTLLVYLSHIMRLGRVIGCSTLSSQITKPTPNPGRRVQWSTQCLTLASQPEQIGWSGSMRRISLAKRLYNASIPSSLIERATGH